MGAFSALLILLFSLPPLWAKGPAANRKGNEAFRKGNYEDAATQYGRAAESLPGDRTVAFNQGTSLLKQKKYDEALRLLLAGSGDPRREVKAPSLYNAGNALAEGQKLPEALSAYRQAILADPSDMNAKFNYELAKRKLEQGQDENKDDENKDEQNKDENQDQNQDQQQNNDQQQNEDQQNKDQEQQDRNEQQNADENEDKAQQNPDQPNPEEGDEQQGAEDQKPQPAARLTKEQAERLLDALKDNEMEMIKARLKSKRKKNVEKDW